MYIETLLRAVKRLMPVAMLFALTACAVNEPFHPIDSKKAFRPTSIAVISGGPHDADVKLAEVITKGLTERSTFRVMSQEEIAKRIHNYPFVIALRGNVDSNDVKVVWFTPSEKRVLDAIQAKLKVDNLFVIWNSEIMFESSNNGSSYSVYPVGNMIEYPGAKVVASTRSYNSSSTSILALFHSKDYYIVDALNGAADDIVDEFLRVTKSEKP